MLKVLLWLCALALTVALMLPHRAPEPIAPALPGIAPPPSPPPIAATAGNGLAETVIARAADGHFYADALVNGATLHLLVDTGATSVALTRADAQAAGVQVAPGDFTATGQGAGGVVRLKRVVLDRVAIGPVAAERVDAVVAEDGLPVSLIGQSFLSRVGTIEISGDRMILR